MLAADMGGVLLLDPSGKFRVFLHNDSREIDVPDFALRAGPRLVVEQHPELAALMGFGAR